jgi:hypothetical protein
MTIVDTNSSQVKLFDPIRRQCIQSFGQAGTRLGALLYPYRVAIVPDHDLVNIHRFRYSSIVSFVNESIRCHRLSLYNVRLDP